MNRNRSASNIKIDTKFYKKDRTVSKSCYKRNKNKRKHNNNNTTSKKNQLPKINNVNNNNRSLNIGFSNCGKTYFLIYILIQKQIPVFIIKKSLSQCSNIKAKKSDEIQPLQNYENNIVVFHDKLLPKQESNIDLISLEVDIKILIYTTNLKAIFISQRILIVIILI